MRDERAEGLLGSTGSVAYSVVLLGIVGVTWSYGLSFLVYAPLLFEAGAHWYSSGRLVFLRLFAWMISVYAVLQVVFNFTSLLEGAEVVFGVVLSAVLSFIWVSSLGR